MHGTRVKVPGPKLPRLGEKGRLLCGNSPWSYPERVWNGLEWGMA
jgi:hypothetical protein